MNTVLIHGCFDSQTLSTLRKNGIEEFAFDLRARSSNLISFKELSEILNVFSTEQLFLIFGDDRKETVLSFLNLLKDRPFQFSLIFRDNQEPAFYESVKEKFYWMFHPEGNWREILALPNASGVLLPLKYQNLYHKTPELWSLIDEKNLDVYLHAESFEEALFMNLGQDMKLSLDLSKEVERSYRNIDQEKLKSMKIWSRIHENSSFQR